MLLVLFLAGVIWTLGWLTKTPHRTRYIMIGALFAVVMLVQIALPIIWV